MYLGGGGFAAVNGAPRKVTDAKADGVDTDASACVGAVLKSLEFKPGKAEVKATVPFDFTVTAKKGAKAPAKGEAKAEKTEKTEAKGADKK